ncbi:MAG: HDOD domain-containing protein [Gracilibacteraceae bacterium]|nr:HDOD domain-containing protein [Gracilibacteraceae bacterium]
MRPLYRLRQFWKAVFPCVRERERDWVRAALPPRAGEVFFSMSPAGQRHAIDTARRLAAWEKHIRSRLSAAEYRDLLQAALLHDCGKIPFRLTVGQRAARVLLKASPLPLSPRALRRCPYVGKALEAAAVHADLGAETAARCGLSLEAQTLIARHHQTPRTPAESLLAQADDCS